MTGSSGLVVPVVGVEVGGAERVARALWDEDTRDHLARFPDAIDYLGWDTFPAEWRAAKVAGAERLLRIIAPALAADRVVAPGAIERIRSTLDDWIDRSTGPASDEYAALINGGRLDVIRSVRDALDAATEPAPELADANVAPTQLAARLLSGEHVGREVVLPDGTRGRLDAANVHVVVFSTPLGIIYGRELAPDDVVTLVAEPEAV